MSIRHGLGIFDGRRRGDHRKNLLGVAGTGLNGRNLPMELKHGDKRSERNWLGKDLGPSRKRDSARSGVTPLRQIEISLAQRNAPLVPCQHAGHIRSDERDFGSNLCKPIARNLRGHLNATFAICYIRCGRR